MNSDKQISIAWYVVMDYITAAARMAFAFTLFAAR